MSIGGSVEWYSLAGIPCMNLMDAIFLIMELSSLDMTPSSPMASYMLGNMHCQYELGHDVLWVEKCLDIP